MVERWDVAPVVTGSIPVLRPNLKECYWVHAEPWASTVALKSCYLSSIVSNMGRFVGIGEAAKDVLEIITVFSARLYGSRSRRNQKLIEGVRQAVEASGQ